MNRSLNQNLLVLALFAFACSSLTSLHGQYLIVGSWNIENLGDRDYGQNPKALAQHILLASVDILALQELHDTDGKPNSRTNKSLDDIITELNGIEGNQWAYEMFPNRDPKDTKRLTGVMWNQEVVSKVGDAYPLPVGFGGSDEVWKRLPTAVKFSAGVDKTDLVVISLHMKSNLEVDGEPSPQELRELEATELAGVLAKVKTQFSDEDIVLIGDTNCKDSKEKALRKYDEAGFRDLNSEDAITFRKGDLRGPFDHVLVPEQSEFKYCRQYILTPTDPSAHLKDFSDHFLIKVAVRKMDDDD